MLTAHLCHPETYRPYLQHPVWQRALTRLAEIPVDAPDATVHWEGESMFVMVQGYVTQPREQCRYEAHRRYLDIQLLLQGRECIECCDTSTLETDMSYDADRDLAFFHPPAQPGCPLFLQAGDFAIFLPHDAHMPKIEVEQAAPLRKAVVKIDLALFV